MTRSALVMSWRSDRARPRIFEFTRQLSFLGSASGPVVRPEAPSLPSPASGGGGACGSVTGSILQPFNPPIILLALERGQIRRDYSHIDDGVRFDGISINGTWTCDGGGSIKAQIVPDSRGTSP